mgnify:CR=1 FL=1
MSSLLERCSHLKNIHDQCVLHLAPSAPPEESVLERRFWVPMTMFLIFQGCPLRMITACMNLAQLQVRCTKVCFLGRNVFSLLKHSSHLKKLHDHCVATPYTLLWYTLCTTRGDCLETLFLGTNRNVSDISGMLNKIYVWLRYGAKDWRHETNKVTSVHICLNDGWTHSPTAHE